MAYALIEGVTFLTQNETIRRQLHHRSIRQFKPEHLSHQTIQTLLDVAQHTASSMYLQLFSVIHILDPKIRAKIAAMSTQTYLNGPGELFIFIADLHRVADLTKAAQQPLDRLGRMDKFLQASADATLALQNMVVAAESLGLGTVTLGSIQNDAQALIDLLHLPKYTFPLLGLAIGFPDEHPDEKPRMPESLVAFTNHYGEPEPATDAMADYNRTVHDYYATRHGNPREETYTDLAVSAATHTPAKRDDLFKVMRRQGFFPES
ncbi:NADPH-dependent oxidoreductase [Lacticaseibacillus casei]|uniref:NADPH-dependent oxidoreductase n=1 Tax=Lacticaseibacillus TaxID=2759736 RepID=UPI00068D18E9